MSEWWSKNWPNVLTAFFSIVVAGIIGFFSATRITENKIGELEKNIEVLKEKAATTEKEAPKVQQNIIAINNLNNRFDSMKDRVELAETRVATIKELTELQRLKTVNELEELLEKYGRLSKK